MVHGVSMRTKTSANAAAREATEETAAFRPWLRVANAADKTRTMPRPAANNPASGRISTPKPAGNPAAAHHASDEVSVFDLNAAVAAASVASRRNVASVSV